MVNGREMTRRDLWSSVVAALAIAVCAMLMPVANAEVFLPRPADDPAIAISANEVMPTAWFPFPSLSQEPSLFWVESRYLSPLSIACDASGVSSGAPSWWAIAGVARKVARTMQASRRGLQEQLLAARINVTLFTSSTFHSNP